MHISDTPPGAVASARVGSGTSETSPSRAARANASTIDIAPVRAATLMKRGAARKNAREKRQPRAQPISSCPPLTTQGGSAESGTPASVASATPSSGPSTHALAMRSSLNAPTPSRLAPTSSGKCCASTSRARGT